MLKIIFFGIIGIIAILFLIQWAIAVFKYLIFPLVFKYKQKLELLWWRILAIFGIISFVATLLLLEHYDSWSTEDAGENMTEEEKELIEFESPRGLPTRYW